MNLNIFTVIVALLALTFAGSTAIAQGKTVSDKDKGKMLRAAVDRVDSSSAVLNEIMKISDRSIPRDLLAKAEAVVVFPGARKAAFVFGAQGGKGVVIRRTGSGWSAPDFLSMGGGSFGAQIGGQKTDYVLLIMNENGLKKLMQDNFEIGAEGSVSAGPVGRTAAASTNVRLDAEILSYSRSKGLFAGIALKGVVISQDEDLNRAVYEKSGRDIIGANPMKGSDAPAGLRKLGETMEKYAK